jgi:hypothetical protein
MIPNRWIEEIFLILAQNIAFKKEHALDIGFCGK